MTADLIVFFDQLQMGIGSLVGGKGANLISLASAGFPIPPGFVVTAEAHRLSLDGLDWMKGAIASFDYEHPDRLRDQCAAVRERLARVPLSGPVEEAVTNALARMLNTSEPRVAFAVRSSSTFEDLMQAAFAGQHDTYLNVRGTDSILLRIRDCFISLWQDRAVLYRHRQGFTQSAARMAVVVQRQIESEVAGVAFSIDPVRANMDRMVVDANYGLGESVVAGECEVDHFELDKASLQIVQRAIGHKEHQIIATHSGIEASAVPADLVDQPCLDDSQLIAIARLLHRVEAHYGWPQDIEWGWSGGQLYQFQSRPVTTIEPRWTRDESAERFPNPMTPLSWDFIDEAFSKSLEHSLTLMGLPPLKGRWFQIFDHYVYGNQNAVRLLAMYRPLRARNPAELVAELPSVRRRFAWVVDLPVNWARDLDRYLIRLGRLGAATEPRNLAEAWSFVNEVLAVAAEYFLPNIAISMTQSGLHRLLHALVQTVAGPERAMAIVDGLLAGCETKTAIVNREIHEMATLASHVPALRAEILDLGGRKFFEAGRLMDYPDFAARFERFLEDHGHREVDVDYSQPTWSGQPWVVLDSLALMLRGDPPADPAEAARAQRVRYAETEQQFLTAVPRELQFFFRELIRLTRTYTMLDDLEHYQTTRVNPLAYKGAMWLGRHLRTMSVLRAEADVFFLTKASLDSLVTAPTEARLAKCRAEVTQNKEAYRIAQQRTPAWVLDESSASETFTEVAGNVLHGLPGSPGRATGPCFIVRGPDDFGRFPSKAVLVARTTNPAWTPLFYSAAAVVTESGGPLSHGAVTAREMGLPAVMSVRGVMSAIENGRMVVVDGSRGLVELDPEDKEAQP